MQGNHLSPAAVVSAMTPGADPQAAGVWAEDMVCRQLRRRGWRIVARNWFGAHSELDVVASRWHTLRIVEVRYRRHHPLDSIDRAKLRFLRRGIAALIRQHQLYRYRVRLDLAGIDGTGKWHWAHDVWQGRSPIVEHQPPP